MIFIFIKIFTLYNNKWLNPYVHEEAFFHEYLYRKTLIFNKPLLICKLRYENESVVSQVVWNFFFTTLKKGNI